MSQYLENNNILNENQGGFRKEHSTHDTIARFTDDLFQAINNNKVTVTVFIDFKKAFDTVNHVILIKKLRKLGISDQLLNLQRDYLSNRSQRTLLNGSLSELRKVEYGVPQGSILGLLLFLIYINDIDAQLEYSVVILFADDTELYLHDDNLNDAIPKLQSDLMNWCDSNAITINTPKKPPKLCSLVQSQW